jgi:hypothetical protein
MDTEQRRERVVRLIKSRLLRRGQPRLLVTLILLITGLAGFLVSYLLLHSGMTRMWLRYPLAILFAYCVFLLLLRLWLALQRKRQRVGVEVGDVTDGLLDLATRQSRFPGPGGRPDAFEFSGGLADAGGGGAGSSWGEASPSSSSSSGGGGSGGGFDLDDGAFIVIAIVVIAGALLAVFYVVYIAPALLAEILVDGVLVAGLYRELKGVEQRHWLRTAVRKTLLPALIAAALFSAGGYALQRAAPKARSVGEVLKYLTED